MNILLLLPDVALQVIVLVVFYLIFGSPARRYAQRIKNAAELLKNNTADATLHDQFSDIAYKSQRKAKKMYGLLVIILLPILYAMFLLYAFVIEPSVETNDFTLFLLLYIFMWVIVIIGATIIMGSVVARYYQVKKLNQLMDTLIMNNPGSTVLVDAKEMIRLRAGEAGVSMLSLVAVVGCLMTSAFYLMIFYLTVESAISCARSSKCM